MSTPISASQTQMRLPLLLIPMLLLTLTCCFSNLSQAQPISTTEASILDEDPYKCFQCYDQITEAQKMIGVYFNTQEQVKKHLKEIATKPTQASSLSSSSSKKPKQISSQPHARSTFSEPANKPIVVSTLRVARSPPPTLSPLDDLKPLLNRNNVDPVLKKLKLQQEKQLNKTCKIVQQLKNCLSELQEDCLGNLQYHTMEVFTKQWDSKLACKPGVFSHLERSLLPFKDPPRSPLPRPISTQNETTRKINELFGRPASAPRGVVLLPTYGSQRSEAMNHHQHHMNAGVKAAPIVGQLLWFVPCVVVVVVMFLIALRM